MFEIPIYLQEKKDGLAADLAKSNRFILASKLETCEPFELKSPLLDSENFLVASENKQIDLHYVKSILVTTTWNDNDDVFHPYEVWGARNTPKDKPLNFEHQCDDIIGHMTASFPVDDEGNLLEDTLTLDELPNKYHILTSNVIYKHWRKKEYQDRIDKLIQEIPEGKWFMSVEALFANFDYALMNPKGEISIVQRNDKTSFLTKHLKAFKGSGVYQDSKIGRLPRQLVFSGQGVTANPANKESIILAKKESVIFSGLGYTQLVNSKNEVKMEKNLEQLEAQLKQIKEENSTLKASLKEIDEKKFKEQIDALTASVAANKTQLEKQNVEFVAVTEKNAQLAKEVETLKASLTETEKKLSEANDNLKKIETEKVKAERVGFIQAKLKFDTEKSEKLYDRLKVLDKATFEADIEERASLLASSVQNAQVTPDVKILDNLQATNKTTLSHEGTEKNTLATKMTSFLSQLKNGE